MTPTTRAKPKVTVYIPCRSYGHFLQQAIESVLAQSFKDWELWILDDASKDETKVIAERYLSLHPTKIFVYRNSRVRGLRACANKAIDLARGEFVIRLDADDYFDENALLVLSHYLDEHPEVGLVYPNYMYVNEKGHLLEMENRKKVGTEAKLLDWPAHGACTMVRRRVLKSIGGYDESYHAQDGHELWLKVINRYAIGNVATPLFYYRQHGESMSRDEDRLLSARRSIKRGLVKRHDAKTKPRVVAVIPAKNTYPEWPNIVLRRFAGRPLIDYTLDAARGASLFDHIIVTTDDPRVVRYCSSMKGISPLLRLGELSLPHISVAKVVSHAVDHMENEMGIHPDIIVLLSVHCPLRRSEHIREGIDTLLLQDMENVISVYEDRDLHFGHGEYGLEPLNPGSIKKLRLERESLFVDNGAINAFWRESITGDSIFGRRIGHVVMSLEESFQIRSEFEKKIVEGALRQRSSVKLPEGEKG